MPRPNGSRTAVGPGSDGSSASAPVTSAVVGPGRDADQRGHERSRDPRSHRTPNADSAISVSSARIRSSAIRPLCGVELRSPKVACAIARARRAQADVQLAQSVGPHVDVLALQAAHPVAGVRRQRRPVPVLYDDQRLVVQGELDVPGDQGADRRLGVAPASERSRPTRSSSSLMSTSISASIASLDGKCL